MRKTIFLAVLLVALVAMPAFASVQNVKISGSLNSMFIHRNNLNLGVDAGGFAQGDAVQDVFGTITKLRVDANLTDNVDAVISLINERAWTMPAAGSTDIDLYEAYVKLREMIYSPLTVVVGRQKFSYGNALIIGQGNGLADSGLNAVANDLSEEYGLDAIRMILDYNPLTVEMFYAKYNANNVNLVANDRDDVDYYGINATYDVGDEMQTLVEGYFFARYDKNLGADVVNDQNDTVYCPGVRVSTNLPGVNFQLEYAHQAGTKSSTTASNQQKRNANAVQFIATYMVPALEEYNPLLQYSYTRLSGDNDITAVDSGNGGNVSGEVYTAWDPMLNDQGTGTIANAILQKTSSQYHVLSLQLNPMEDVTTKMQYVGVWLDKAAKTAAQAAAAGLLTQQPDGSASGILATTDEKHVGNEFDWITSWNYTEDVTFGANLGIFIPGKVANGNNKDAATQAIFNVNVAF